MPRSRVVEGHVDRLPLSDGDWVDVKRELNAGEYHEQLLGMADRRPFTKIVAYVVAWSLLGVNQEPIPYSLDMDEDARRATVASLNKRTWRELTAAIDRHEAAQEAAAEEKKSDPRSAPVSSAT